jgi:hypothetical protein
MPSELSPAEVTHGLAELLEVFRFHYTDEDSLQRGVEEALTGAGVEFTREAIIDVGRLDFLVHASVDIGIEIKIDGAPATVVRQLTRYLNSDSIQGLVLVTSKRHHRRFAGTHVTGKSLEVVWLGHGSA